MSHHSHLIRWSLILALPLISTCGSRSSQNSELQFDAAHSVALDGNIAAGTMLSPTGLADDIIVQNIRSQLAYTVGQLNGMNGVARLSLSSVKIIGKRDFDDGSGLTEISYGADMMIAWDRFRQIPSQVTLVLPARGDQAGLESFMKTYGYQCVNDEGRGHGFDLGNIWYYYRPLQCGLNRVASSQVRQFPLSLKLSAENTQGKSPEYGKIWEDGQLTITTIFAANVNADDSDIGVAEYNNMYQSLLRRFGSPVSSNVRVPAGRNPGTAYPNLQFTFRSEKGMVDINMLLIKDITQVDESFKKNFAVRTKISDIVTYSGHAGLGANVRALADMSEFVAGKYQIFMVNGCDTFAYADNKLRDAHAAVNPGASPSKYFDLITNAMPSYFHWNAHNTMHVMNTMISARASYREMLNSFDVNQRAVVTGEEDNMWPAPF